jgi:serine/threonine-protein kinase
MATVLVCPQGHRWQPATDATGDSGRPAVCPVCGASVARPPLDETVQATASSSWNADADGPASPGTSAPAAARYRPLHFHARGGLGEVHVAYDDELRREVALKRIQDRHAHHRESLRRFLIEAEITGRLEHPGVVPVYGLVRDADGQPCYAMRLIQGRTLADALRELHASPAGDRGALLRQLLGRFVTVCNTVAYAHSRGVLHRDLKPGNVMLGQYGETLVLDWGLAKSVGGGEPADTGGSPAEADDDAAGTRLGAAIGTPAFMSPEQAAGRWDLVGPASDVYSLGATLYAILSGQPPYPSHPTADVLRRVQQADFPPPRQHDRAVPRPLEAVCLKAMARRPEDRYGDALALAADVEHWLAYEPVCAYREPWPARLSRLARRHQTVAAAVAVLLLTATAALSLSTWLIGRERDRAEANAHDAHEQRQVAEVSAHDADTQRRAADTQRRRAKANYDKALAAVDRMLTELGARYLVHVPEMEPVRERVLKDALKLYQELLDPDNPDPAVRVEMALLYIRTARIHEMLGQLDRDEADLRHALEIQHKLVADFPGDPTYLLELAGGHNELGLLYRARHGRADAEKEFDQALALIERLTRDHPEAARTLPSYREYLANIHNNRGIVYQESDRYPEALAAYRKSLAIRREMARDHPHQALHLDALATAYSNVGAVCHDLRREEEAEQWFRKAEAIQEPLAREFPQAADFQSALAKTQFNLGIVFDHTNRRGPAEAAFRAAVATLSRLVRTHPSLPEYRAMLVHCQFLLANVWYSTGRKDQAVAVQKQALALLDRLVEELPADLVIRKELALGWNNLGIFYREMERLKEAEAAYRKALPLWEGLTAKDHGATAYQDGLGAALANLGLMAYAAGRFREAAARYERALAIEEPLVRDHPLELEYRFHLAKTHHNRGVLYEATGRPREAEAALTRARDERQRLVRASPTVAEFRHDLAQNLRILADLYQEQRRTADAAAAFRESAAAWRSLLHDGPQVVAYRQELAVTLYELATLYVQAGRPAKALAALTEARSLLEQLAHDHPDDLRAANSLAACLNELGELYVNARRFDDAAGVVGQALDRLEMLAQRHPEQLALQHNLAVAHFKLGRLRQETGRAKEAEAAYRRAVAVWKVVVPKPAAPVEAALGLGQCLVRLGRLLQADRPQQALDAWAEAAAVLEALLKQRPGHVGALEGLGDARFQRFRLLVELGRHADARDECDAARKLGPGPGRVWVEFGRAATLARMGEHARAVADAEAAAGKPPRSGDDLYNLACVYAVASATVHKDAKLPAAERQRRGERYAARAVALLGEARSAGLFKRPDALTDLKTDPDLAPVRSRAEFTKLLGDVEKAAEARGR